MRAFNKKVSQPILRIGIGKTVLTQNARHGIFPTYGFTALLVSDGSHQTVAATMHKA